MRKLFLGITLFLFLNFTLVLADVGPGPERPIVTLSLKQGGKPYTGNAEVTYLCSNATQRGPPINPVKAGDLKFECSGGTCTNNAWYYKFNQCFYSKGRFEVVADGKKTVSQEISLQEPGIYSFELDVDSGKVNLLNKTYIPCIGSLVGILLIFLFVLYRK